MGESAGRSSGRRAGMTAIEDYGQSDWVSDGRKRSRKRKAESDAEWRVHESDASLRKGL